MISFDALKTEVVARLGNRTDIQSRSERWINYAFFELLLNPRFSFFELDKIVTVQTGVQVSEIVLPSIATLWHILSVRDTTNFKKLDRTHFSVIDKIQQTQGFPARYYRFGTSIFLDPIPLDIYDINIRYRDRPDDLASGSNFRGMGSEWEEPLIVLSTIKGFDALDQRAKSQELRILLEPMLQSRLDVPTLESDDAELTAVPALVVRR